MKSLFLSLAALSLIACGTSDGSDLTAAPLQAVQSDAGADSLQDAGNDSGNLGDNQVDAGNDAVSFLDVPASAYGSQSNPGNSCSDLALQGASANGLYWLKTGSNNVFQAYCDMTFVGYNDRAFDKGWTLIYAEDCAGGCKAKQVDSIVTGSYGYLSVETVEALAKVSNTITIRTAGMAVAKSITSLPNSLPIGNLMIGEAPGYQYNPADWVGSMASIVAGQSQSDDWHSTVSDGVGMFPDIWVTTPINTQPPYGFLLGSWRVNQSTWDSLHATNEAIEVYLGSSQ